MAGLLSYMGPEIGQEITRQANLNIQEIIQRERDEALRQMKREDFEYQRRAAVEDEEGKYSRGVARAEAEREKLRGELASRADARGDKAGLLASTNIEGVSNTGREYERVTDYGEGGIDSVAAKADAAARKDPKARVQDLLEMGKYAEAKAEADVTKSLSESEFQQEYKRALLRQKERDAEIRDANQKSLASFREGQLEHKASGGKGSSKPGYDIERLDKLIDKAKFKHTPLGGNSEVDDGYASNAFKRAVSGLADAGEDINRAAINAEAAVLYAQKRAAAEVASNPKLDYGDRLNQYVGEWMMKNAAKKPSQQAASQQPGGSSFATRPAQGMIESQRLPSLEAIAATPQEAPNITADTVNSYDDTIKLLNSTISKYGSNSPEAIEIGNRYAALINQGITPDRIEEFKANRSEYQKRRNEEATAETKKFLNKMLRSPSSGTGMNPSL